MSRPKLHQVIPILMLLVITPTSSKAQTTRWDVDENTAHLAAYEYPLKTTHAAHPKTSKANAPESTNSTTCNKYQWVTGSSLEMRQGDSVLKFSYMEDCDKHLTKTMSFTARQIGEPSVTHWYTGSLVRHGKTYALLGGKTSIELLSEDAPFRYKMTFHMRFAPDEQFRRSLAGKSVDETQVLEVAGETTFTPRITCESKTTGYKFDSKYDGSPPTLVGFYCSPWLGSATP